MEGSGISRLDCYEDMFKEITRKLYGEDPDHRTSSVQNEFEASVSYKNDEDTGNGTDGSDDGNWTCEDEPFKGTDGSRIAAYHAGKATWRCYECGDLMSGSPREAAEHFVELHSSKILADESRNRHHSPRKDFLSEFKVEDLILYLERLRERAERSAPPARRTQETQTVAAALFPMANSLLLQELPPASVPQLQNTTTMTTTPTTSASTKRYTCPYCPYGTDRRDLYTRHENIHREEKPYHCYLCLKPFNRADHVKKHFSRMHRDQPYDITRIRRPVGTVALRALPPPQEPVPSTSAAAAVAANANGQQAQQQHTNYQSNFVGARVNQLQPNAATAASTSNIYQATNMPNPGIMQPDVPNCSTGKRVQNGGCNSKSHLKGGKSAQERKFPCSFCHWTGVDNWCLKRHMNTHLKPFLCSLCEYKAARSERLATHVLKVHNRRQCSRCSFIADDVPQLQMHQQLHAHRSNTNATATSTAPQATPSPSNRHQQPLHPGGAGRPPPGPPVFPAPAPAIAPTTSVISPSTILGNEMVKSPATAATMTYPMEEEKRSYRRTGGIDGDDGNGIDDDNDGVVRGNGNCEKRSRDHGACYVCGLKNDRNYNNLEPCCDHGDKISRNSMIHVSNDDFKCSYSRPQLLNMNINTHNDRLPSTSRDYMYVDKTEDMKKLRLKPTKKRSRKQSQPRRLQEPENDDPMSDLLSSNEEENVTCINTRIIVEQVTKHFKGQATRQRLFKCHLCPRYAPARRLSHRPYHTIASLTLHKLWRHKRRSQISNSRVSRVNLSSLASSITLKATLFTDPSYHIDCRR